MYPSPPLSPFGSQKFVFCVYAQPIFLTITLMVEKNMPAV